MASQPARVLIVDDDAATRQLFAANLEAKGLVVLEATDGLHGLERARLEQPDLVVTDIKMPLLDGFELAAELRRDKRTDRIPFIFHSGETTAENEARARRLGAIAFLTKPLDPAVLAALVTGALEQG
jgi:two-component system chemotaxis response regulator CheY